MYHKKNKKQKGFTLIEMLVSVAIFSIILIVIMGSIVSIVDVSRKARTMTEVMNNLNFTFESMTRTLKTATSIQVQSDGVIVANNQDGKEVKYKIESVNGKNKLQKSYDNGGYVDLTSEEVDITEYIIEEKKTDQQPRVFFSMKGRVETAKGIVSEFSMQTTVSQRQLKID